MFDQLYKAQRARERHFNAPLLDERIRYLTHWAAQGSIRSSLHKKGVHANNRTGSGSDRVGARKKKLNVHH